MGDKKRPRGLKQAKAAESSEAGASGKRGVPVALSAKSTDRWTVTPAASETPAAESTESRKKQRKVSAASQAASGAEAESKAAASGPGTLMFEVSGASNEVEEVEQMLLRALADLEADQLQDSVLLLRGCVHECDKMVRIRSGDIPNATDEEREVQLAAVRETPILPAVFHFYYGTALFNLGLVEQAIASAGDVQDEQGEADLMQYMDAAIDRLEMGLELPDDEALAHAKIHGMLGKIKLHKAALMRDNPDAAAAVLDESEKHMREAMDAGFSKQAKKADRVEVLSDAAAACFAFADKHATTSDDTRRWADLTEKLWQLVRKVDAKNTNALVGLGSVSLLRGDQIIQAAEEMEDPEAKAAMLETANAPLKQAVEFFREALKRGADKDADGKPNVPVLCLVGEACVHLGNINDDDDDEGLDSAVALEYYTEAMRAFKTIQASDPDALPAHFAEFVADWEADMVDQQ
ncbi:hypothetical protein HK105_207548 [Polyrhizophydium stewartii]|uniref:Uncharacterized protein n=1 Tax=Polyrhizophydium stewartii TaxID=2732419 RepID=A0ABR4N0E0_9FUNG|nr:hypothetical protein HK105_000974 [Polyrhizophydium stewartii]